MYQGELFFVVKRMIPLYSPSKKAVRIYTITVLINNAPQAGKEMATHLFLHSGAHCEKESVHVFIPAGFRAGAGGGF